MPFDGLLKRLEEELQTVLGATVAEFIATARTQLEGVLAGVAWERANGVAEVAKEKADLHRTAMYKQQEAQQGRVVLDIGGYRHATSVQTLRRLPGTFFDAYFSGRYHHGPGVRTAASSSTGTASTSGRCWSTCGTANCR
jgi:hypothetical protein